MKPDEYTTLKNERTKLRRLLDANKNLQSHSSYNLAEKQYRDVQRRIKAAFRDRYYGGT